MPKLSGLAFQKAFKIRVPQFLSRSGSGLRDLSYGRKTPFWNWIQIGLLILWTNRVFLNLVLWTHSFSQIPIFEPRTLPLTGNALYIFESATVRQTIAIQLWRDFLCHRTHLFPVINLRYKAPPTSSLSVFHFFSFPFFGRNFWKMELPNFTSAFFLFQEFWWFRPFAFIHQLFIILLLFSKEELFHSFPSLFLKPVILLNSRFSFEKVEW